MVVVTSDENLSTSNENTDDTVKESSHRGDVETIESKPNNDEVGVTSDISLTPVITTKIQVLTKRALFNRVTFRHHHHQFVTYRQTVLTQVALRYHLI